MNACKINKYHFILDQMINRGRRVVFAGDDTWMSLFPNRFTRAYPYPSFDVWDLDTVDRGVEKHLYKVSLILEVIKRVVNMVFRFSFHPQLECQIS